MNKRWFLLLIILPVVVGVAAQLSQRRRETEKDTDPLALQIFKSATAPIKDAKALSFRTLTSREILGSNDPVITVFSTSEVTLQRPDRIPANFRGRVEPVQVSYDGSGQTVLYSPSVQLDTTIKTPKAIGATLSCARETRSLFA